MDFTFAQPLISRNRFPPPLPSDNPTQPAAPAASAGQATDTSREMQARPPAPVASWPVANATMDNLPPELGFRIDEYLDPRSLIAMGGTSRYHRAIAQLEAKRRLSPRCIAHHEKSGNAGWLGLLTNPANWSITYMFSFSQACPDYERGRISAFKLGVHHPCTIAQIRNGHVKTYDQAVFHQSSKVKEDFGQFSRDTALLSELGEPGGYLHGTFSDFIKLGIVSYKEIAPLKLKRLSILANYTYQSALTEGTICMSHLAHLSDDLLRFAKFLCDWTEPISRDLLSSLSKLNEKDRALVLQALDNIRNTDHQKFIKDLGLKRLLDLSDIQFELLCSRVTGYLDRTKLTEITPDNLVNMTHDESTYFNNALLKLDKCGMGEVKGFGVVKGFHLAPFATLQKEYQAQFRTE